MPSWQLFITHLLKEWKILPATMLVNQARTNGYATTLPTIKISVLVLQYTKNHTFPYIMINLSLPTIMGVYSITVNKRCLLMITTTTETHEIKCYLRTQECWLNDRIHNDTAFMLTVSYFATMSSGLLKKTFFL